MLSFSQDFLINKMSNNFYEHSIILPFSKECVDFREINSKEEYILSKFNKNSPFNLYENLLFKIIKNCVRQTKILNHINILDYICLNTSIRIKSLGNIINLSSILDEKESKELGLSKINFKLDLFVFLNNVKNIVFVDSLIHSNNVIIKLNWPTLSSYFLTLNQISEEISKLLEFIEEIKINDKIIKFNSLSLNEKLELCDKLPVVVFNQIRKNISKNLNELINSNLYGIDRLKFLNLNFMNENLGIFFKLLYQNSLENLLDEYLILSKNGVPLDFIFNSDVNFKNNLLEHISNMSEENSNKTIQQENFQTGLEGLDFDSFIINTQNTI